MKNENSVCFIGVIKEVIQIPGADNIEQAFIGGWSCIIKKGSSTKGDHVVVATTDAVIPEALAESLNVTNYLRKGNRVRTVKLKGVYSECLIMDLDSVPQMKKQYATGIGYYWDEGEDLMELLGIYKFEPPVKTIQLSGGRKIRYSDNPNFHIYYKFPNIKNVEGIFKEDEDEVEITRKIHGTNARYGIVKKKNLSFWDKILKFLGFADKWIEYEFCVGSHNVEKGSDSQGFYDTNVWRDIDANYRIKKRLWDYVKHDHTPSSIGSGFVLYGEIYGAGIQQNYDYGLNGIMFKGFDITINGKYQSTEDTHYIISEELGLSYVDILFIGPWRKSVQDFYAMNQFIPNTKIPEEGIVIKHLSGGRSKVAKVINPDYLIYAEKKDVGDSH